MEKNKVFGETKMITNEQIAGIYFSHIQALSDREKSNIERKKAVTYLENFLDREGIDFKDLETSNLDDFVKFLKRGDYRTNQKYKKIVGSASIRQIIALLKAFYLWLFENHNISQLTRHPDTIFTTSFKKRLPKSDRKPKVYLEASEVIKFIDSAKNDKKALLYVIYDTMGRISAVLGAKLDDYERERGILTIYESKNNVYVQHELSDATIFHLNEYIDKFRPVFAQDDPGNIFISKYMNPLTARAVQRYIKTKSMKELGKNLTPHKFRGLGITHMLEAGADVATVADIVGHKDKNTTLGYHISNPKFQRVTKRNNHPLLAIDTARRKQVKIVETVTKTKERMKEAQTDFLRIIQQAQKELDDMLE